MGICQYRSTLLSSQPPVCPSLGVPPTESNLRGHEGGLLLVTRRQWLNADRSFALPIAGILYFIPILREVNSFLRLVQVSIFLTALSISRHFGWALGCL
jgi:hypothetical protein